MVANLYNDYLNLWEVIDNIDSQLDIDELDLKCPACNGDVILKDGDVRMKHFAHKRTEDCKFFNSVNKGKFIPNHYLRQVHTAHLYEDKIRSDFKQSVEEYLQDLFEIDLDFYNGNCTTVNTTQRRK